MSSSASKLASPPIARRTSRRRKPSRRCLDAGILNALELPSSSMRARSKQTTPSHVEKEHEPIPGPSTTQQTRKHVHPRNEDPDDLDDRTNPDTAPRPAKRPRTVLNGESVEDTRPLSVPRDSTLRKPSIPSLAPAVMTVKLWDDNSTSPRDDLVSLTDLTQVLSENNNLSLYMGQSNIHFPENLRDTMLCEHDLHHWHEELSKPGVQRRVMIFDPAQVAIVPHNKSPTIHDLELFLTDAARQRPAKNQLRLFAGEHTSFFCLPDTVKSYVEEMSHLTPNNRDLDVDVNESADFRVEGESLEVREPDDSGDALDAESSEDESEVSSSFWGVFLDGEESDPELSRLPPFRGPKTKSEFLPNTGADADKSLRDSASDWEPVPTFEVNAEHSDEDKRWSFEDSSCSSFDSIFGMGCADAYADQYRGSEFIEEEVLDGGDHGQSQGIGAKQSSAGPSRAMQSLPRLRRRTPDYRLQGTSLQTCDSPLESEVVLCGGGQQKKDKAQGRNRFRTNPVGPDERPMESEPYSTHVYIWNYHDQSRSDTPLPLKDAIKKCKESTGSFLGIYDGQDYDFEKGPLAHTIHMFHYDFDKWRNRRRSRDHRVRIWNRSQRSFRAFQFCPQLTRLAPWLRENPDLSVFEPSALDPTYSAKCKETTSLRKLVSPNLSPSGLVWTHLLRRMRHIGVTAVHPASLRAVQFWNTAKRCKEKRQPFSSRAHLAHFLLANPWMEIYCKQDEVEEFELSSGFRLIPIFTHCPAEFASFWDKHSKKRHIQAQDHPDFTGRTVHECLTGNSALELYLGQDTDHFGSLSGAVKRIQQSGSYSYMYMLAHTGEKLQPFLAQGWTAVHVNTSSRSTGCAVFWKKKEQSILMQPEVATFSSIRNYLLQHGDNVELYTGQDFADSISTELARWFKLLTYKPGFSRSSDKPMLTRSSFFPSPGVLKDEVTTRFFEKIRSEAPPKIASDDERELPASSTCIQVQHQNRRSSEKKPWSNRRSAVDVAFETRTSSNKEIGISAPAQNLNDARGARDLGETNRSAENDGSTDIPSSRSPGSSTTHEQDDYDDSLDSELSRDDRDIQASAWNEASESGVWEAPMSRARERANRMSSLIKESGPKILNRQLKQDIRQKLREDLLLNVDSSSTLITLAARLRSSDFVFAALDLCSRLEGLDVYECFSDAIGLGYGPSDLLSLRADLETGKVHTIAGVVGKFRRICADLLQFHTDCALLNEAILLKHSGEKIIEDFIAENRKLVLEEVKISRIASICERGRKIGFQQNSARRNSRKATCVQSPVKVKPSIRVTGYQSHVTFLNYRDDKGHSVMGKRHSARVFGLSIDHRACETRAGNVQPCHVCERELFHSEGDSLQCSNHKLDLCDEMMCRSCLESVFSMNEKEFDDWRQSDNWICVHCRGLCVDTDLGKQSRCSLYGGPRSPPKVDAQFAWSLDAKSARSVQISLSFRTTSGEFPEFQQSTAVSLSKAEDGSVWRTSIALRVGVYRCRVDVGGKWEYSTTFHVLPTFGRTCKTGEKVPPASVPNWTSSQCAADSPMGSARRRIEWKIAKQPKPEVLPVHSFSEANGGAFVKSCSRTEGYDWKRSKRHAIIQWIPEVSRKRSDEHSGTKMQAQELRLTASTWTASSIFEMTGFPRLKVGMSWREFEQEVHAFKFDYMRNETLWGIVTGTSRIHGIGLFTQTGYQKGDFVIEYAGDLIRTPLGDIREKRYEAEGLGTYLFKIDERKIVDATVKSNRARFTNHSCDPNMAAMIVNVRGRDLVVLIATRNIPPFAELTFNYQLPYEDKKLECLCNSWNCVGVMN